MNLSQRLAGLERSLAPNHRLQSMRSSIHEDHIAGLGDTADFAIVGGRRDARDEQELGIGKLW
jgi:hypothetical protein